jgi:hypothetical protein
VSLRRGMAIPGSKYYREFCYRCKDPMRVQWDLVGKKVSCDDCAHLKHIPPAHTGLCKRQRSKLGKTTGG